MLLNPYRTKPTTFTGTRLLQETLGILGVSLPDPTNLSRIWSIQSLFAPSGKALGGLRIKLVDPGGFVTFTNQRDVEVLLGLGRPGDRCPWSGGTYVSPGAPGWVGFCADEDDLLDDLQEREILLRGQTSDGVLLAPLDIIRRVHLEPGEDFEEHLVLVWDGDVGTGVSPDPRLETIQQRWARVDRRRVRWDSRD